MLGDDVLSAVEASFANRFGPDPARASVSFLGVERIDVLRWRIGRYSQLATLGASRHPMAGAETMHVDPIRGPRAEILLLVRDRDASASESLVRVMAMAAASPSVEGIVLRHDGTIDFGTPITPTSHCTGFLLDGSADDQVAIDATDVEPVRLFTAIPVTANELAWARARGGAALREQIQLSGADTADLGRQSISFDPTPPA